MIRKFRPIVKGKKAEPADRVDQTTEPIVEVKEQKNRIVISYTFPGFYSAPRDLETAGKTMRFSNLTVQAAGSVAQAGKPKLPSFGRYVQIPFASNFSVSVTTGKAIEFDDLLVTPSQPHVRDDPDEDPELRFEKRAYASSRPYPGNVVETSGSFVVDGYRVLLVHVRPLQFVASERKILAYQKIKVTIDLIDKGDQLKVVDNQGSDLDAFGNLLVNPGRNIDGRVRFRRPPVAGLRTHGPEMLIIYHGNLEAAAKLLARWKNRKGIRTEIVAADEIGANVADFKRYIRNRRRFAKIGNRRYPSRLRYVLLLGDVGDIPAEDILESPWGSNITDYYYSTRTDPSHATDLIFPRLAIGRIPVSDEESATAVVKKIIRYERRPTADPDYYDRMTFAAYFEAAEGAQQSEKWYVKTMEDIRDHMITLGFDIERVYISGADDPQFYEDGTPVPQDVKDAFAGYFETKSMLIDATNEGRTIIAHRDHATVSGWSNPNFQNWDLQEITTSEQSIFFSLNCSSGGFDDYWPQGCFAENLLKLEGGAPSLMAATRSSSTLLNDDLMRALFDALWAGVIPTFPNSSTASYGLRNCRLGDILNYAKSYLPTVMSEGNDFIKDHFEIYHVIGDPTLEIWKEEPRVASMRVRLIRRFGSARPFLSIRLSECPVGSVLTIWHKQNLIKRIEPRTTHIMLPLGDLVSTSPSGQPSLPHSKRRLEVCFSAPGYRFRSKRIDG